MTIDEPQIVSLLTPTGEMRTLVFRPSANKAADGIRGNSSTVTSPPAKFPGLVLFSEIFQITAPIRRTAAYLAGQGFVVAVPEIYHEFEPAGTVLAYDQAGADRGNALKTTKELSAYDNDAKAVLDHLATRNDCNGNLGVIGICIGGHLAFRAAMNANVKAGVCFYATDIHKRSLAKGMNDNTLDRMKEIKAEMLMIWGRQDPHIPREGRRIVYDALTDAGINFTWHEFNAQHAFMRDEGPRYDPELARICYGLTIDLFRRTLG